MEHLQETYLGVELINYIRFALILAAGFLLKGFISRYLSKYVFKIFAAKSESDHSDSFATHIQKPLSSFIFAVIAYLAFMQLAPLLDQFWLFKREIKPSTEILLKDARAVLAIKSFTLLDLTEKIFFFIQIFTFTNLIIKTLSYVFHILTHRAIEKEDKERQQLLPLLRDVLRVVIWTGMVFVILGTVFDVNVAALIAGLGVGGIAIAFALKDSLENLLSSFMILLDKPFVIGDYINISGVEGNVEAVGFRSTQIRTLDKTLVSIPNRNLISNSLENFSERGSRRMKAVIGAEYGLSVKQLENIIAELKKRIDSNPYVTEGTIVNLDTFADSTVNINAIYYIKMDIDIPFQKVKEQINIQIYQVMYEYGTGFAFPTQTLITTSGVNNVQAPAENDNTQKESNTEK